MEHMDIYEQTHKKGKTITTTCISLALAGALLVGGCKVASVIKGKNLGEPETTMEQPELGELVLTQDFDINNSEEVSKRAEAIYNLSEKEYTVLDIKNSIYVANEIFDNIVYPDSAKTDDEKFEYLQQLSLLFGATLDDYLFDYVSAMDKVINEEDNDFVFEGRTNDALSAYMWMPTTNETKNFAIDIAKVYCEQRNNIRNNNKAAMIITANEYYDLFIKAKQMELSVGNKVLLFKQFSSINPLFTPLLSKEQTEELDNALGFIATATNKLFSEAAEGLDISEKIKESLEKGNFGKEITKHEEKYVPEDKNAADKIAEKLPAESTTTVVDKGGKPVNDSGVKHEVITNPTPATTTVEESEFIVEIPEGTTEVVIPGGKVTEEETVTEPYTTNAYERYVDADAIDAEKYAGEYEKSFTMSMMK